MFQNATAVGKLVGFDIFGSVIWYPVWWYTKGFKKFLEWCADGLKYRAQSYAFRVWIKNFFVPMYAQYDWTGRLISVFMRFFVILFRGIAWGVEALAYLFLAVLWLLLPPLALAMLIKNSALSIVY